ncbi:MAG TPA: alpha/beta fold hydrolase [Candidatus Acidoferrales bacterium]|nr:alpha/beta fold hydrolase [Candidatus Acidoferrales bacterium]
MKSCALGLLCCLAVLPAVAQETDSLPVEAAKQVLRQIVAGQFGDVEAQYDTRMSAALPAGALAVAWGNLLEQAGSFDSVSSATASKSQSFDVVVLACKFEKKLVDVQIVIGPDGKLAGLHFFPHQEPPPPWVPPGYARPDSFAEKPLTLVNGTYELPGTLTMPKKGGSFAAVVLVQGSGPEDQDETIGPNKPFEDLAWGLASRGIAVFRYTKRTEKYGALSSADPAKLTVEEETMSDARAAVALVAKQAKVESKRVFLLGHSLGGYLAPRIAAGDSRIAGIVMLAANTQPIEQLLLDQVRQVVSASGAPTDDGRKQIAAVEASAKWIESPDLKIGDTVVVLGSRMPASYWLDLRTYHPIDAAKALKIPILILQGGRDSQIAPAMNFDEWKAATAGQQNVTLKLYPDLNHLFIAVAGPSQPQDYEKPGHVDEHVVADIAAWVAAGGKLSR